MANVTIPNISGGELTAIAADDSFEIYDLSVTTSKFIKAQNMYIPQIFVLGGDISTGANTTPVNVTGLVFSFATSSKYIMELFGIYQAAAATTGFGLQWDVSAAVTLVTMQFFHQLANTGTLSGGSSIADDASTGVSSGFPTAATNVPVYGSGILITTTNAGTAQLRLRSETTAVATLKANTILRVTKVA